MAKINLAQPLATTLEQAGIKRIWGLTGDSLNGLTDALRTMDSIEWMHVRHEEVAAFAAGAEAAATGELTVCAGSCGPGNLHLINGLFDCHRNHVPVLAIAAQIPSSEIGLNYFRETHPQELFKECSHFIELVTNLRAGAPGAVPRHGPGDPQSRRGGGGDSGGCVAAGSRRHPQAVAGPARATHLAGRGRSAAIERDPLAQ